MRRLADTVKDSYLGLVALRDRLSRREEFEKEKVDLIKNVSKYARRTKSSYAVSEQKSFLTVTT